MNQIVICPQFHTLRKPKTRYVTSKMTSVATIDRVLIGLRIGRMPPVLNPTISREMELGARETRIYHVVSLTMYWN